MKTLSLIFNSILTLLFYRGLTLTNDNNLNFWKREEVRGLFVLGVITTIQGASKEIGQSTITFGTLKLPFSIFTLFLTVYWGLYALLMVFALSDDIFDKSICNGFKSIGKMMLEWGIYLTLYLFLIFFIVGNRSKLHYVFLPVAPSFLYLLKKYLNRKDFKSKPREKISYLKIIKKSSSLLLLLSGAAYVLILSDMVKIGDNSLFSYNISKLTVFTFTCNLGGIILWLILDKSPINNKN